MFSGMKVMNLGSPLGQTFQRADLCPPADPTRWYALHTRSRYEKIVDRLLSGRGFETFLPLRTVRSPVSFWQSREAQVPLFPGYTFARFSSSAATWHQVRATTGVARIVGSPSGPVSIPDMEIDTLKTLLAHNVGCSLSPSFLPGQRVVVAGGPLKGIQGEIVRRKNRELFVVKVHLIRRMLEVDFRPLDLELLSQ